MTELEIACKATDVLRHMFGSSIVPDACGCMKSSWLTDPFARGSYSYVHKDDHGNDTNIEDRPFDESNLFYMGEAVSDDNRGTVHGALLEGRKAAQCLLETRNSD